MFKNMRKSYGLWLVLETIWKYQGKCLSLFIQSIDILIFLKIFARKTIVPIRKLLGFIVHDGNMSQNRRKFA